MKFASRPSVHAQRANVCLASFAFMVVLKGMGVHAIRHHLHLSVSLFEEDAYGVKQRRRRHVFPSMRRKQCLAANTAADCHMPRY
eukprot:1521225-Prymnesium_polylepis.1